MQQRTGRAEGSLFHPFIEPVRFESPDAKTRLQSVVARDESKIRVMRPGADPCFYRFVSQRQARECVQIAFRIIIEPASERKRRNLYALDTFTNAEALPIIIERGMRNSSSPQRLWQPRGGNVAGSHWQMPDVRRQQSRNA